MANPAVKAWRRTLDATVDQLLELVDQADLEAQVTARLHLDLLWARKRGLMVGGEIEAPVVVGAALPADWKASADWSLTTRVDQAGSIEVEVTFTVRDNNLIEGRGSTDQRRRD